MAERKATNKYYPPDWDPSKGSVNSHKKSHPLRDRARKIHQGILVVRFEMPYNIWCLKCNNHIGMGVRYNAEKSKVGNYYTSPIYKFRMKCHLCDNYFEIQTDPSKFDYVILSGARKQVRLGESNEDELNSLSVDDEETKKRKITDAMFRLEKKIEDKIESEAKLPGLQDLKNWRTRWEDSFSTNQLLRTQYRQRRKNIEQNKSKDKKLLQKSSLKIPLVKSKPIDKALAREIFDLSKVGKAEFELDRRKRELLNSSFTTPPKIKEEKMEVSKSVSSKSSGIGSRIKKEL